MDAWHETFPRDPIGIEGSFMRGVSVALNWGIDSGEGF